MSGQLIELIIFAGIAFFVINKLIATLGTTSDEDGTKHPSVFGEKTAMKDVTTSATNNTNKESVISANILKPTFARKNKKYGGCQSSGCIAFGDTGISKTH